MATKHATTTRTKRKPTPEATWTKMRTEFIAASFMEGDEHHVLMQNLAGKYGVRLREAENRAWREDWKLERAAGNARAWLTEHGLSEQAGEAEVCEVVVKKNFRHLCGSEEGRAVAYAIAHEVWHRVIAPLRYWEAKDDLRRAEEVKRALDDERNRLRRAGVLRDAPRAA